MATAAAPLKNRGSNTVVTTSTETRTGDDGVTKEERGSGNPGRTPGSGEENCRPGRGPQDGDPPEETPAYYDNKIFELCVECGKVSTRHRCRTCGLPVCRQ